MRPNHFCSAINHKIGGQMKLVRGLLSLVIVFSLGLVSFVALPSRYVVAQESNTALQRGYRTGYSDGYMAAYRDSIDNLARDFARHSDYTSASRAFNKDYGPIEEYRDGYKQGFETGYGTGFDKQTFDSTVPANLTRRDGATPAAPAQTTKTDAPPATEPGTPGTSTTQPATPVPTENASFRTDDNVLVITKDTELILELQDPLSTNHSSVGDKFTAKVVSPAELSGAVIEGRINKIQRPGRIKRRSELSLSFDRIVLSENRWSNFSGILTEVLPVQGDNIRKVDNEGTAI